MKNGPLMLNNASPGQSCPVIGFFVYSFVTAIIFRASSYYVALIVKNSNLMNNITVI